MKISVCIITLNEEENLRRCLGSCAALADEIVVLDSGSTDGTETVAREFGACWAVCEWPGYVQQKNKVTMVFAIWRVQQCKQACNYLGFCNLEN